MAIERLKQKRWLMMALYVAILVGLSFGFTYLFQYLMAYFNISVERFASTAYLLVFVVTLVSNAAILVPVYIHVSIMMAVAKMMMEVSPWGFVLVALVASVAGVLGEMTAYYAGYLGKRIAQLENIPGYQRLVGWMNRHGPWGIFLISAQPILPVDIAGLLAGASKLPVWKFLLPCWAAKFLKYLLGCYLGPAVFNIFHLPSL
jgi:membrane protein YqaA with SNARE-associated domain